MTPAEYIEAYPNLYGEFKNITMRMIARGYKNGSADAVFHIMRWERSGERKLDGFKVNNNYTSFFARRFEEENPQHQGFFRKRKSKFDEE